ncbi:hypothetical protein ANCDUO_03111 [Ancylostoma duodenale]|uniref:Uncharacterized protein n=1 Tax=Ancylostoma duodenale TaxID=51022 RepID=A0A0C2DA02_9BILA|nr:hypothetical protein ANCDUO_03111 [Ancylostoma duodenale]
MGTKMKLYRERVITLDTDALARVLKVAYDRCVEWTDFVCSTNGIRKHATVENHSFDGAYDTALRAVKERISEESRRNRSTKAGPIGFAAPETARMLEKDGEMLGIRTRVIVTFRQLSEVVTEWKAFSIWILVWPIDIHTEQKHVENVALAAQEHMKSGGRIITAWPPITVNNRTKWIIMSKLWKTLDEKLLSCAGAGQMAVTASNMVDTNKKERTRERRSTTIPMLVPRLPGISMV